MRSVVTRLSPEEWYNLKKESGAKPIYRAFRKKYEWEPSLKIHLTEEPMRVGGKLRQAIHKELITEGSTVAEINAAAKSDKDKYGTAEHDGDVTLAVWHGYAVLVLD
jgi:hypothetical protein